MQEGYCGDARNSSLMKLGTSWKPTAAGTPEICKSAIVDKPATAGTSSIATACRKDTVETKVTGA
jgi:hypothetical protein